MNQSQPEIIILPDRAALAHHAATRFVSLAQDAIHARGRFVVALAGGSTPRELYHLLASPEYSTPVEWPRVHLFWGDERAVPPDHPDSNFRMANDVLISQVPIPMENVHRIRAELSPADAAREYENGLRQFFSPAQMGDHSPRSSETLSGASGRAERGGFPHIDLILLGLGEDAHTASLFPRTPILRETSRWVAAVRVEKLDTDRITLTAPLINAAENILFLVAGADKGDAVQAVLRGELRPEEYPAQLIQPSRGKVVWLMDEEASQKLRA